MSSFDKKNLVKYKNSYFCLNGLMIVIDFILISLSFAGSGRNTSGFTTAIINMFPCLAGHIRNDEYRLSYYNFPPFYSKIYSA